MKTKWYSYEKKPYDCINHQSVFLYSKARYPTKKTANDLPPSFIYGRYYKRWGYLDTADIVDMLYVPNLWINHFLKDDRLVISYTGKIKKVNNDGWTDYENEDFSVWGFEIIEILKGAKKYSGIDIKPFVKQIKEKLKVLKQKHPEEFGKYDPEIDRLLKEPIKNYDYFKEKKHG